MAREEREGRDDVMKRMTNAVMSGFLPCLL